VVRRRPCAVSNHEAALLFPGLVLRDACSRKLLRMRGKIGYDAVRPG
jgi:hypothetical protein